MALSPQEIITRRAFDDDVIYSMLPSPILEVEAYKSIDDVPNGRAASRQDGATGKVNCYVVSYRFPILIGPDTTTDHAVAVFNTDVPDYPFRPPIAHIVSRPFPWSPHFHPEHGLICLGDAWRLSRGSMLLAHAIVHVARLLNCDEKDRGAAYIGWNEAAINYWRHTMHRRPLSPELPYPAPRAEVTHGVAAAAPLQQFRLIDDGRDEYADSGFCLMGEQDMGFQLIGEY